MRSSGTPICGIEYCRSARHPSAPVQSVEGKKKRTFELSLCWEKTQALTLETQVFEVIDALSVDELDELVHRATVVLAQVALCRDVIVLG